MTVPNKQTSIILKDGKFDVTTLADLDALIDAVGQSNTSCMVIHFHGGLVDLERGIAEATFLTPVYRDAGATPVFFIWESGWKEILEQNLPSIFSELIFQELLARITQLAKAKVEQGTTVDGQTAKSIGLLHVDEASVNAELEQARRVASYVPFTTVRLTDQVQELSASELQQAQTLLQHDSIIQTQAAAIAQTIQAPQAESQIGTKSIRVTASTKTLMSPAVLQEMRSPGDSTKGLFSLASVRIVSGALRVLIRVIDRFIRKRDHGFYKTIVEEILREFHVGNVGKFLWDGMKKSSEDAFQPDPAQYGGTAFLEGLGGLQRAGKLPSWIVLVGHSAGSIYISHFLVKAAQLVPNVKFDVVLVAPAVTFGQFGESLTGASTAFGRLRVFGMRDDLEQKNALVPAVPFLYPSSLLYFVSGVLEDESDKPLVGMQRFYSRAAPYNTPEIDRVVRSGEFVKPHGEEWADCNDGEGASSDQHTHGGLDQASKLLASLQYIISKGY